MTDSIPLAQPMPDAPSEEAIRDLVYSFYDAVRTDPLIGPVFDAKIAPDAWPTHLAKMCDFWSSVLRKSRRYDGRPLPPHLTLGPVGDAHFARWLSLFRPVARRALDAESALRAIAHAERMAMSFRMGIAVHKGEDSTRIAPLPEEA
ncbi:group III truncated hemoglobin [Xanthobacter sediminis]|uniref:group III truncated hemoglobin n=1 Tax=Xanthobacter sediminis TaxID=3119926 RepID=UPI003727E219